MIPRSELLCRCLQILLVTLLSACQSRTLPESSEGPVSTSIDGIERVHEVTDRLLTGSSPDEAGYRELQGMGVEIVLSVDGPMPPVELIRELGMRSVHLPIGYDGVPTEVIRSLVRLANEAPESKSTCTVTREGIEDPPWLRCFSVFASRVRSRRASRSSPPAEPLPATRDSGGPSRRSRFPKAPVADASLPESVAPASLVRQMVEIQNLRDRLDSSGTTRVDAGRDAPASEGCVRGIESTAPASFLEDRGGVARTARHDRRPARVPSGRRLLRSA